MANRLLTVAETARRLKRNPVLVYRWIADGRLPAKKYGHAVLVGERDLARFERNAPQRRERGGRR